VGDAASYPRYIATARRVLQRTHARLPIIMQCTQTVHFRVVCHAKNEARSLRRQGNLTGLKRPRLVSSTRRVFRSTSLAPSKTAGNGYYAGIGGGDSKLSRCTLTLLQQPDWYDRFVVSVRSRAQVLVLAGFRV